jgi:putative phosphoribosyl transferase
MRLLCCFATGPKAANSWLTNWRLTRTTKIPSSSACPGVGVPVAFEVATGLNAPPLDVFVVRKLGVPEHEELAMGAAASGKVRVLNQDVIKALGISDEVVESVTAKEEREIERRERLYRGDRAQCPVEGKRGVLVDDGLATGSTMRAAVLAMKRHKPARVIVAVPVAAVSTCEEFKDELDEIVCATTPQPFYAVGQWYQEFSQTTDEEVQELLRCAPGPKLQPAPGGEA